MLIQHFVNVLAQSELLRFPHPAVASAELLALELMLHRHHVDLVLEVGQLLGSGDLLGLAEANQVRDANELLLIETLVELGLPTAFILRCIDWLVGCCLFGFLCFPLILESCVKLCGLQRRLHVALASKVSVPGAAGRLWSTTFLPLMLVLLFAVYLLVWPYYL